MRIHTAGGTVEILNEPTYSFGSSDNARAYPFEQNLAGTDRITSTHGVLLNGAPVAVFGQVGGCSAVHEHSAVYRNNLLYLAVGDSVACFCPHPYEFKWATKVDSATCFGIFYHEAREAFISHGELEIARLLDDGKVVWSASGEDIFSEGFSLTPSHIEAIDFNGKVYNFDYDTGALDCGR